MHPKSTYCLVILTFLSAYFAPALVDGQQQSAPSSVVEVQQQASTTKDHSTISASSAELPALAAEVATTEQETRGLDASATPFPPIASLQIEPAVRASQQAETATVGVGSWIERILIEVENLNLNNHKVGAKLTALSTLQTNSSNETGDDDDDNNTNSASNNATNKIVLASDSPASSEEDPLESTSTLGPDSTTLLLQGTQQKASTQYSLSGGQPSVASISWPVGQSQEAFDDDEQRLVDSNNVSAILASPATRPVLSITTVGPKQSVGCEQAYTHCALRKVCAPALKAYNDDCQDLINNRTSHCSAKCLKAMIALRSSEEGDDLVNCDCQGHEYCEHSKQRSQTCRPQVEQAVDPKTVVSCSTASWICMADQLCSTALEYYYRNCQSLFSQGHCSMRCNNSLSILYRQPKASKLINCYCDGSEEFPCVKYKTYTERFCLNRPTAAGSQLDVSTQVEDNTNDDGYEEDDDTLNMTNDPEASFGGGGSFSSSSASSFSVDDDQEECDDPKATDDAGGSGSTDEDTQSEESSSAASLNGIQTAEDNWIPLMSGRFFTNLHQQQQRLAQQQQQHQKFKQSQHRQPTRKSQKTAKQKTKSNSSISVSGGGSHNHHETAKRNRHASRLHTLAATSSAIASNGPWTFGMLLVTIWIAVIVVVVVDDDFYSSHRLD